MLAHAFLAPPPSPDAHKPTPLPQDRHKQGGAPPHHGTYTGSPRQEQRGTTRNSAADLLLGPGGGSLGVNASAATTAVASCDTYTTAPADEDGGGSPVSASGSGSSRRGRDGGLAYMSEDKCCVERWEQHGGGEGEAGNASPRKAQSSRQQHWHHQYPSADWSQDPPPPHHHHYTTTSQEQLSVRSRSSCGNLQRSLDGALPSHRHGRAEVNTLRHSFDPSYTSHRSLLPVESSPDTHAHTHGHTRTRMDRDIPQSWRDSLQCLRRSLSLSGNSSLHSSVLSRSRLSTRHSETASCDNSATWSLESASSHPQHGSNASVSTSTSVARLPSLMRRTGGRRGTEEGHVHADTTYRKLWVPRPSASLKRERAAAQSDLLHRRAFSYSSPRGDVLIVSTLGDVVFCTYLKDKAGRMRPCRLLVAAHEPLKLRVGKVDKQMCQEILAIRDESTAYQVHGPSLGEDAKTSSSESLSVFANKLWMTSYHITSLPSSLSSTYNKVFRMLLSARKRIPKLILYITQSPPSGEPGAALRAATKDKVMCKCMLMSNSPLPDFYMRWADGTRLSYSLELSQLQISHVSDASKAYRWDGERSGESDWTDSAPKEVRKYLLDAQIAMRKCLSEEGKILKNCGNESSKFTEKSTWGSPPYIIVDCLDGTDVNYQ